MSGWGGQCFDCVLYYCDASVALQQSLDCAGYAVFRYYSEDDKFWAISQSLDQFIRVESLKNVEGLLFQDNLLVRE